MATDIILVDPRRGSGELAKALGPIAVLQELNSGDFAWFSSSGEAWGIEKKTIWDYLGSLTSERLQDQLVRLAYDYKITILLIEGPIYIDNFGQIERRSWGMEAGMRVMRKVSTGHRFTDFILSLLSVWYCLGVWPLISDNPSETPQLLLEMYRWSQKPEDEHGEWLVRTPRIELVLEKNFPLHVMRNFPMIGPKLGKEILKFAGNLQNVANMDTDTLASIPGIGKKRAETIFNTFREEYKDAQV